jgi:hypothetical protein
VSNDPLDLQDDIITVDVGTNFLTVVAAWNAGILSRYLFELVDDVTISTSYGQAQYEAKFYYDPRFGGEEVIACIGEAYDSTIKTNFTRNHCFATQSDSLLYPIIAHYSEDCLVCSKPKNQICDIFIWIAVHEFDMVWGWSWSHVEYGSALRIYWS